MKLHHSDYLQKYFGERFVVTEELNFDYQGDQDIMVVKSLPGNVFADTIVQPIQLTVYAADVNAARAELDAFAHAQNLVYYEDPESFAIVKQYYGTPTVLEMFNPTGTDYVSQIILSGTLVATRNVSDIVGVKIDGFAVKTSSRIVAYVAETQNLRVGGETINRTNIPSASLRISLQMLSSADQLTAKIRAIRSGSIPPNTTFSVELTHTDDYVETHTVRLESASLESENQNLPTAAIVFVR